MTWFTRRTGCTVRENYDSKCEHLEIGSISAMTVYENDGIGCPAEYHYCAECWKVAQEEEAMETDMCYDCRDTVVNANLNKWVPYDYIPSEDGDPIKICNNCLTLPTHVNRVAKNKAAYDSEFPEEEEYDDEEWWDDDDLDDEWDDSLDDD